MFCSAIGEGGGVSQGFAAPIGAGLINVDESVGGLASTLVFAVVGLRFI